MRAFLGRVNGKDWVGYSGYRHGDCAVVFRDSGTKLAKKFISFFYKILPNISGLKEVSGPGRQNEVSRAGAPNLWDLMPDDSRYS